MKAVFTALALSSVATCAVAQNYSPPARSFVAEQASDVPPWLRAHAGEGEGERRLLHREGPAKPADRGESSTTKMLIGSIGQADAYWDKSFECDKTPARTVCFIKHLSPVFTASGP